MQPLQLWCVRLWIRLAVADLRRLTKLLTFMPEIVDCETLSYRSWGRVLPTCCRIE